MNEDTKIALQLAHDYFRMTASYTPPNYNMGMGGNSNRPAAPSAEQVMKVAGDYLRFLRGETPAGERSFGSALEKLRREHGLSFATFAEAQGNV